MDKIVIRGARENNLKNVDITLPKDKLIVLTGVSGSGKSSLAFDTIYAEGQRRYVESLSAYARQFLGGSDKPDVDSIEGLSPSIAIDQKSTNKNPRSTVGTITEIYDYLRLLYSRIGTPTCPKHHIAINSQSIEEMTNQVLNLPENTKIEILSPVVRGEKGNHASLFDELKKDGYSRVLVNGEVKSLLEEIKLEKNIKDNIDVVIDRLSVNIDNRSRIFEAIEASSKLSSGKVLINVIDGKSFMMSENYACMKCDFSIGELEPRMFSFNSPFGACPTCKGLGYTERINIDLLIPNRELSLNKGAIKALTMDQNIYFTSLQTVCKHFNIDMDKPVSKLSKKELDIIFYGTDELIDYEFISKSGKRYTTAPYEGIINNLERRLNETTSTWIREWLRSFMSESPCPTCGGARLREDVLSVLINKKSIHDLTLLSISDLLDFINNLKLTKEQTSISELIIKEIKSRLQFLINVGLNYLSLSREAATLSGGEAQRIRLATQIGSKLSGVLYVLDEPSIGLHQRDNEKLINSLKEMRDLGNTLIVVEHDTDTMLSADYLVDVGPGAGDFGGEIIAAGTPEEVMKNKNSLTGKYLTGELKIDVPKKRRKGNGKSIKITGAHENNLKNIDVEIPLGKFVCVTGVSGSGKSSLVNEIIYKELQNKINRSHNIVGKCKTITGVENVDKVVMITQDAIGRTPRSNPATYIGLFDDIRDIFASMKEAKIHGYDRSRFSFNVKGGRCEACQGDGVKKIEMHFLPDVYVNCDVCGGKRYNKETLAVKFKDYSIADILNMRVSQAKEVFANMPKALSKIDTLMDVGLTYITLGQNAVTLSGGEAGRVKLAKELQKKPTGKSIFILDEPTTGLHSDDIKKLITILNRIVDNGDTVLVIEHNLDVIKVADHIIDLGPEGGNGGGTIVAVGTPEEVANNKLSYTGEFLKKVL